MLLFNNFEEKKQFYIKLHEILFKLFLIIYVFNDFMNKILNVRKKLIIYIYFFKFIIKSILYKLFKN